MTARQRIYKPRPADLDDGTHAQINFVDRVVYDRRHDVGIDYDSDRWVLLRALNGAEVWWWASGKSWTGNLEGHKHRPGELLIAPFAGRRNAQTETLHEGGRLSLKLLNRTEIFAALRRVAGTYLTQIELAAMVARPPKTIIITKEKP